MFYKEDRTALFIDGINLHSTSRALGFEVDYKLLRQEFMKRGRLVRAFYYTALFEHDDYSPVRPLIDWLNYNGYQMRTKTAKEYVDQNGRRKIKGNIDVELAVDALELASQIDHAIIFTGDGDFRALVASLQRKGVRVSAISTIQTQQPMIADDLRRQVDNFVDLNDLRDLIGRMERVEA